MSIETAIALALALGVMVATPGPGAMAVMACAVGRGFGPAAVMVAGIVTGDLIFVTAAVFGLAALAAALGELFLVVKLAGAGYLVWLGVKMWRADPALPEVRPAEGVGGLGGLGRNALVGLTITLGNPKVIAFYIGFLPSFIDLERLGPVDLAFLAAVVVTVIGGALLTYARLAATARRALTEPRRIRIANRVAGSVMIGVGVAIALRG